MNRYTDRFLPASDYLYLREIGIPYEGYVEGMGYVTQDTVILPPAYYAYDNPPRRIHPRDSFFVTMNVATLDYSQESIAHSYRITPQEISQQIINDGFFYSNGQPVQLPQNYDLNVTVDSRELPGGVEDTVTIKVTDRDTGNSYETKQSMVGYLNGIQNAVEVIGFAMEGIELSKTNKTIRFFRNNGETFSPKVYNGWNGGSAGNIRTFKVLRIASKVGKVLVGVGVVSDLVMVATGDQNITKAGLSIGCTLLCFSVGGPVGLIIGISYFVADQCGLIDPIADWIQDILFFRPVITTYRLDPYVIQQDNTRVVKQLPPLPIIIKKD